MINFECRKIAIIFPLILFVTNGITHNCWSQKLVINEFLASNDAVNKDPDFQEYSDWIEIYNPNEYVVDLGGFYLTDNLDDPTKWQIPESTIIEPLGFLIFWSDGRNATSGTFHTNFKLAKSGEEIGLFNPDSVGVDSIKYDNQITDISFGRHPDGGSEWHFFNQPTPNSSNNTEIFLKAPKPELSLASGFYTTPQLVEITAKSPSALIRYTLNGDEPTLSSPVYSTPIVVKSRAGDPNIFSEITTTRDPHFWLPIWVPPRGEVFKATVIRAQAFIPGYEPSDIVTSTFFVDENIKQRFPSIAVISLVSDFKHLFDNSSGIYVPGNTHRAGVSESGNYFQDWEKPAHIEFFEQGRDLGFALDIGIQIQGGTSPASPQKAFHVIARSKYGDNRIRYPIFKNCRSKAKNLKEFKRFIIRAWGSTIGAALFNDAYAHSIFAESELDIQAYRPAVVFINGEYWGVHELREANKNSWYYQGYYGFDRDNPGYDILLHEGDSEDPNVLVDEGDAIHWNAMVNYIETHDLSIPENYEYVKTQMDVDNFIAYLGHCIFVGKWDWPNNNEATWRPKTADGKWRWIQFDMETGFGVATGLGPEFAMLGPELDMIRLVTQGVEIPGFGRSGPHSLLIRLLQNTDFQQSFVNWFDTHLKAEFLADTLNARLDEMVAELEPYMAEYAHRWPFIGNLENDWHFQIEKIRQYNNVRQDYLLKHLVEALKVVPDNDINFSLYQNYPNPFNPITTVSYQLPSPSKVILKVFDALGRQVEVLKDGYQTSGLHSLRWNAQKYPSGSYYYSIKTGKFTESKKMLLLK